MNLAYFLHSRTHKPPIETNDIERCNSVSLLLVSMFNDQNYNTYH